MSNVLVHRWGFYSPIILRFGGGGGCIFGLQVGRVRMSAMLHWKTRTWEAVLGWRGLAIARRYPAGECGITGCPNEGYSLLLRNWVLCDPHLDQQERRLPD